MTDIIYVDKRVSGTEDKGLYVAWKDKGISYVVGPFACIEYAKNYKARSLRYGRLVRPGGGTNPGPHDTGLLDAEAQEGGINQDSAELRS